MRLSKGEITGLAAACLAIVGVGAALNFSDDSPHLASGAVVLPQAVQVTPKPERAAPIPNAPAPTPTVKPSTDAGAALVIKHILPITGPIAYGEWHWDETGAPPGPPIITVDLDARVLSVFRGGYEIATAAVLVGAPEKPTPTGVFPITQKDAHHVSNLYDAPMPYMLRLTNDGVTIHATKVENGYASHGCVGTPLPFAKKLFGIVHVGDKVYITKGKHVGVGDPLVKTSGAAPS